MSNIATQEVSKTAVEVGQVFAQGHTDGLILYALILATFLMFLALVIVSWLNYRERVRATQSCAEQAKMFVDASNEASEALKQVATAVASSTSANVAFQQTQASMLQRLELALVRLEPR